MCDGLRGRACTDEIASACAGQWVRDHSLGLGLRRAHGDRQVGLHRRAPEGFVERAQRAHIRVGPHVVDRADQRRAQQLFDALNQPQRARFRKRGERRVAAVDQRGKGREGANPEHAAHGVEEIVSHVFLGPRGCVAQHQVEHVEVAQAAVEGHALQGPVAQQWQP